MVIRDTCRSPGGSAEEALRLMQASIDGAAEMVAWFTPDGRVCYVNDATCRTLGYSREELLNMTALDFMADLTPQQYLEHWQEVRRRKSFTLEVTHRRKDGSEYPAEVLVNYVQHAGQEYVFTHGQDITDRQRARQQLRQSREDLDRAQAVGQIGWWRLDTRQNVLTWSPENHRIFGVPEGTSMSYEFFLSTVHPDDRAYVDAQWHAGLRGEPYDIEHRIVADGKVKWVREKAYLEFDPDGALLGGFGITQDITARRQAEEDLRRSAQRFELFARTSGALLQAPNPQEIIESLCRRVMEHLGCHAFFNFLVDQDAGKLRLNACAGIPQAQAERIEWLEYGAAVCGCAARDGCRIVAEHILSVNDPRTDLVKSYGIQAYACHPLFGPGGEVLGTLSFGTRSRQTFSEDDLATMRAVTDQVATALVRMRDEQALRRGEARWNAAIESFAEGAIIATEDEQVIYWNPAARDMHGIAGADENIGPLGKMDRAFELWTPDGSHRLELHEWPMRRIKRGEPLRDLELRLRRLDQGWEKVFSYSGTMVDTAGGERLIFLTCRDLTELRRTEEALRAAKEGLEQRVRERTAELSLRTEQLRALASELTLAEQRERRRLAEVLHDELQQLLVAAKFRLTGLLRNADEAVKRDAGDLDDLLDQSIECSRSLTGELSPPILHQSGLVAGLEWLAVWMRQKHGLDVDLRTEADAAPESEDVMVLLFQSVRELLFNAVKHAQVRTAQVAVRKVNEHVEVTVSDRGAGFDPRAIGPKAGRTGGFGLFSIRERIGLLGGTMDIDSGPGRGSRFTLMAPRGSSARNERQSPDAHGLRISRAGPLAPDASRADAAAEPKIRVLLADDHVVMRQGLSHLLRNEPDIEVIAEASDGKTAVDLVRQFKPDVVLMDISMPEMDGVEATRIVHAEHPAVRIVGLSMFQEGQAAARMKAAGAAAYLTKSGPSDELLAAIRACREPADDATDSRIGGHQP